MEKVWNAGYEKFDCHTDLHKNWEDRANRLKFGRKKVSDIFFLNFRQSLLLHSTSEKPAKNHNVFRPFFERELTLFFYP